MTSKFAAFLILSSPHSLFSGRRVAPVALFRSITLLFPVFLFGELSDVFYPAHSREHGGDLFGLYLPGAQTIIPCFLFQFQITFKPALGEQPRFDGMPHRTTRLGSVGTVVESALGRQFVDIDKGPFQIRSLDTELPHSGGIDDNAAARDDDQLPTGGGMPPPVIVSYIPGKMKALFRGST